MMETKQKYFSPECEIVELRITQGMLSGSPEIKGDGANPSNWSTPYDSEGLDW